MFKCCECDKVFVEPEISKDSSGVAYAQCPNCGSGFEEAYPCKDCGEYFLKDELNSFYCLDCLKENWDKADDLFEFAKEITNEGDVNEFAMDMFGGIEGVNDILK